MNCKAPVAVTSVFQITLLNDENNNREIRHQRPRNNSFINDLKTTEFSEKFSFSVDYGKNYNSDEYKTETFQTSNLENLEIIFFLKK